VPRVIPGVQRAGPGTHPGRDQPRPAGGRLAPALRLLGVLLVLAHLALVAWLVLRPLSVAWVYGPNVRPLATINRLLLGDPVTCVRDLGSGLVLLAPLGVLLPMVSGKLAVSSVGSFTRTVFLGAVVSFAIECLKTGVPGRVFDVDSILLNTVGVAVVHLAVVPGARARLRRGEGARLVAAPRARVAEPAVLSGEPGARASAVPAGALPDGKSLPKVLPGDGLLG
jgi:VanZ like family